MLIELDGRCMTDRASAHDYLQDRLGLTNYYGRNLDALYDILCEVKDIQIRFFCVEELKKQLGGYGDMLISTLLEAVENNPAMTLELV